MRARQVALRVGGVACRWVAEVEEVAVVAVTRTRWHCDRAAVAFMEHPRWLHFWSGMACRAIH